VTPLIELMKCLKGGYDNHCQAPRLFHTLESGNPGCAHWVFAFAGTTEKWLRPVNRTTLSRGVMIPQSKGGAPFSILDCEASPPLIEETVVFAKQTQ
jgi:hypothetical protein